MDDRHLSPAAVDSETRLGGGAAGAAVGMLTKTGRSARAILRETGLEPAELVLMRVGEPPAWSGTHSLFALCRGIMATLLACEPNLMQAESSPRLYVRDVLRRNGLPPAPHRKGLSWKQFIQSHLDVTWAADFFTEEVWTLRGLVTFDVLFFIHASSSFRNHPPP